MEDGRRGSMKKVKMWKRASFMVGKTLRPELHEKLEEFKVSSKTLD